MINDFVTPYIDDALRLSPEEIENKNKSEGTYTLLHALAAFSRDRKMLRDQLVAVLLAGRDTTASTLSWVFYELARNPDVVKRLRQEIIDQVGLDQAPTYANLKNMKYLQNVMSETLRIYPSGKQGLWCTISAANRCSPIQCSNGAQGYHSPPRRWTRWTRSGWDFEGHAHCLLDSPVAAKRRSHPGTC